AIDPEYPFRARRLGHEGTVAFTVLVGAGGAVLDITLEESSGYAELDRAAQSAVGGATYISGSLPAPMPLRVRVVFALEDGVPR
ncbi:MAG: energy transducer TonB, partial [Spirochaetia bacterium]